MKKKREEDFEKDINRKKKRVSHNEKASSILKDRGLLAIAKKEKLKKFDHQTLTDKFRITQNPKPQNQTKKQSQLVVETIHKKKERYC